MWFNVKYIMETTSQMVICENMDILAFARVENASPWRN
jgi:hypothetical protein